MLSRLTLGDESCYPRYVAEFDRLFQNGSPILDAKGRTVTFDAKSCRHVCFKEDPAMADDPVRKWERTIWQQERAECIPWILETLANPSEIRVNHAAKDHHAYLLSLPSIHMPKPQLRFYVSVALTRDPLWVRFETAFIPEHHYWVAARKQPHVEPVHKRKERRW